MILVTEQRTIVWWTQRNEFIKFSQIYHTVYHLGWLAEEKKKFSVAKWFNVNFFSFCTFNNLIVVYLQSCNAPPTKKKKIIDDMKMERLCKRTNHFYYAIFYIYKLKWSFVVNFWLYAYVVWLDFILLKIDWTLLLKLSIVFSIFIILQTDKNNGFHFNSRENIR